MCLHINKSATTRFKRKQTKDKKIIVYKVLEYSGGKFVTPYQRTPVKCGWFRAKGKPNKYLPISGGAIHVYRRKYLPCSIDRFVIKCWAYRKDLIAVGDNGDSAFTKIYVPKSELDRISDIYHGV